MYGADRVGHEDLHRLAQQLAPVVSEEEHRLRVDEHDPPSRIDTDDCVGRGLQESPGTQLGPIVHGAPPFQPLSP